ncbi:MAG: hypothetical protein JWL80_523, partial [Parcubacteria group bacterium]|nr:hypothetical protein [Parcubacteria group bacterium]
KASPVVEDIVSKIETKEESPLVETEASKALNKKLDEANTPIRIAQLTDEEKRMKISRDLTMPLLFKMDIGFIEHELRSENPNYSTLFGNLFEAWESYEASTKERSEIEDAAFVISTLPGASEAYREFVTQKDKMA